MGIMFDILLPLLLFFVRDLGTLSWRIFEMRRHFTFEGGMLQGRTAEILLRHSRARRHLSAVLEFADTYLRHLHQFHLVLW